MLLEKKKKKKMEHDSFMEVLGILVTPLPR